MARTKTVIKIPFDKDGNLIDWTSSSHDSLPSRHWENCGPNDPGAREKYNKVGHFRIIPSGEWRDNYVFHDTLTVTDLTRGRSAARINLEDDVGRKYTMFLTDVLDLIKRAETIAYGMIEADWTFQKRGSNYGIRLA